MDNTSTVFGLQTLRPMPSRVLTRARLTSVAHFLTMLLLKVF